MRKINFKKGKPFSGIPYRWTGKHFSKEHKRKISQALKGTKPQSYLNWRPSYGMLGKKHSKKTKRKMIISHLGKKYKSMSEKGRINISRSHKGKHHSEETKKKISKNHRKHQTEKTKKKLSNLFKGERGSNWKGGITSINKKIRNSIEYRLWREAIYARDNWTCQKCKIKGGKLHPHHILNFSQYPLLRFAINNGITFCQKCHKKFHKKFGFKNNNYIQITEFLKVCNVVLRLKGKSKGADEEVKLAKQLGIPVVTTIEELKKIKKGGTNENKT